MMKYSTNDELEAIERSARMASSPSPKQDTRRGSSLFSVHDAAGDLIVGFPGDGDESYQYKKNDDLKSPSSNVPSKVNPISVAASSSNGGGPRRDSVVLQPIGGMGGLIDFDDSDFEDSDDDDTPAYSGGLPGAPMSTPGASPGGPNHRPLVGGFAAAAYEAAREYHYQHNSKGKSKVVIPKRTGPPPSI